MVQRRRVSAQLPDFPWDTIASARAQASAHPDGIVDLSVGTPVDEVASVIQDALAAAAGSPGYPLTHGTPELRRAVVDAMARRYRVTTIESSAVLPVIGTKELIASLPRTLGIGPGDVVVIPEVAYPTYEVGALLAGATIIRADSTTQLGPQKPALIYLNSPSNPTGKLLGIDHLRKVVAFARETGAIIAADECYLGLVWEGPDGGAPSILDPRVCDGDVTGLLAIHSLSKTSNMASYRAGFVTGDPELVSELLAVRKHSGMMMPRPIQAAMTTALSDDEHEADQRERYRSRRDRLAAALRLAGFRIDHSQGGLYLWVTRAEACRLTLDWLAEHGILAAPGEFYGPAGSQHVRVALTGTDERIDAAVSRLSA